MSKYHACLLLIGFVLAANDFAKAQQPSKVPGVEYLNAASSSINAARDEPFGQGLRDIGMSQERTSLLNGGTLNANPIVYPRSRPNSCVSKKTSSSLVGRQQPVLPRKQLPLSHRHDAGY